MISIPYEIGSTEPGDITGSSLKGHLRGLSYKDLERIFGEPTYNHEIHGEGDGKVCYEWDFKLNDDIITIYDWKEVAPRDDIKEWNIGGFSNSIITALEDFLSYLISDCEVTYA